LSRKERRSRQSWINTATHSQLWILGDVAYAFFTYHFEAEAAGDDEPFLADGRDTLILPAGTEPGR
jgi:hypothetical protein